ncbi:50S ribosomal protein L17 [Flavobacteriaceae bacterium]|jgi:large subunit ribosomal protein L17|nr:50S ribosomal protein L17 [Flavobacteriales bacterium]MDA9849826.1 50S ribosomal protein L17 [Flavobacteriaceae bacterium]
MRHGKKINHLGRKTAHRKSMLANMACSLIEHKRINTTTAKAKALKQFVEPLITKSKNDTTQNRRIVFSRLRQKEAVAELFREVSAKIADRPGGYTRVIRLGNRLGDNADMAMIELVDYNETYNAGKKKKSSTRRRKKSTASKVDDVQIESAETVVSEVNDDVVVEPTEAVVEPTNVAQESTENIEVPSEDEDVDAKVEDDTTSEKSESSEEK